MAGEEALEQVGAVEVLERADEVGLTGAVIPEKVFALGLFLLRCGGGEDFLTGIGMIAGVVDLCGECHRRRCEVLDLFEMKIEFFGLGGQFGHIDFAAAGVGGDKIRYELLFQAVARVDALEKAAEFMVELERGFAHEIQHSVRGVFRSHFQTA